MNWVELRLEHDQPAMSGLITFDGRVVEVFGFNDVHSVRLPVALLGEATVSFKSGLMSQPAITFRGRGGAQGYNRAIEPPDEQQPEIEDFVAEVNAAIERNGDNQ